jgi:[ribosomal protein S5]-alanine N-acetyltransferase
LVRIQSPRPLFFKILSIHSIQFYCYPFCPRLIYARFMNKFASFETDRLLLNPLRLEDATDYQKHFVDYEVIQHLSANVPWPYPENGVREFLEKIILPGQGKERWTWGIFLKVAPQELIGCVDLWRKPCPENRGFWLGRKFWGQGYMSEAIRPIMDYAFNDLGFEKVFLTNAVGNERSRRVKEKSGARLIETRPAKFVGQQYNETELWELSKEAWFKNNSKS